MATARWRLTHARSDAAYRSIDALLWVANGRIAGIGGILGWRVSAATSDVVWRFAVLGRLVVAPLRYALAAGPPAITIGGGPTMLIAAGLLFGLGPAVTGMVDPAKVLNFPDPTAHRDPSLAFATTSLDATGGGEPGSERRFRDSQGAFAKLEKPHSSLRVAGRGQAGRGQDGGSRNRALCCPT
jgi:hypothetical protein